MKIRFCILASVLITVSYTRYKQMKTKRMKLEFRRFRPIKYNQNLVLIHIFVWMWKMFWLLNEICACAFMVYHRWYLVVELSSCSCMKGCLLTCMVYIYTMIIIVVYHLTTHATHASGETIIVSPCVPVPNHGKRLFYLTIIYVKTIFLSNLFQYTLLTFAYVS